MGEKVSTGINEMQALCSRRNTIYYFKKNTEDKERKRVF
jgi:hypothetical protein